MDSSFFDMFGSNDITREWMQGKISGGAATSGGYKQRSRLYTLWVTYFMSHTALAPPAGSAPCRLQRASYGYTLCVGRVDVLFEEERGWYGEGLDQGGFLRPMGSTHEGSTSGVYERVSFMQNLVAFPLD